MDELTRTLWKYAGKYRLEGCYDLDMQQEREESETMADRNRKRLEERCTPQAAERVGELCYCMEVLRAVDAEAAFVCGLRLGLSLR
ncbi:MAG: hypothetical protein HFF07_06895 [Oscillospiraceae bacterium]|nr:hypothetical protein [Oscillospiraceae bacterium]